MNTLPTDEAVMWAARAALADSREVSTALSAYLAAHSPEGARFAAGRLRAALVGLAEGWEGSAHDGSTFGARKAAAENAVAAWPVTAD